MVAKNSEDWLPSGWSVGYKVNRNGQKNKYYFNSETDQKFNLKKDLVRYLNSIHSNPLQSTHNELRNPPQAVNTQLSEPSREEQYKVILNPNEIPEWLPEGWIMALKTSQSGSDTGKDHKCYVNPSTGHKFYSKTEVFKYLKSGKNISYSSEQETFETHTHSRENDMVEALEVPEWLPEGWSVERKIRSRPDHQPGTPYKSYVDSSTGLRFYSKPQVERYLKHLNEDSGQHSAGNVTVEGKSPKWLPKGWNVELKIYKSGKKIGKTCKYFVEPSTKRKFFSKPQVFRHLGLPNHESPSFIQKNSESGEHSTENVAERPNWLPKEWIFELRTYNSGANIGKKYKCFVEPSTRRTFFAKTEVFRYLKSVNYEFSQEDFDGDEHSTKKVVMGANKSPEWLPNDWTVELKTCKSGKKIGKTIKYYVDPLTGRKFMSRPEVFRYLGSVKQQSSSFMQKDINDGELFTENLQSDQSPELETSRQNITDNVDYMNHGSSSSKLKNTNVAMGANKSPEWLPNGWTIELKTCKSGTKIGKKIKYYVDPLTGRRFLSKPEVFRYLGSVKRDNSSFMQKDISNGENSTKNVVMGANQSPEWLPNDWTIELKTCKSGTKIGKKLKYYVDPLTGRKFMSRPEVLRYLGSVKRQNSSFMKKDINNGELSTKNFQSDQSPELETSRQNTTDNINYMNHGSSSSKLNKANVSVETVAPDGLPPGWVLEIRKKGKRRDPYYTDPVNGYVFRSKKDVFRYLETGKVSKYVLIPKSTSHNDSDTITSSKAKTQEISGAGIGQKLFAGNGNLELGRVTRASSKTVAVANPTTDSIENFEGTSLRRVTRAKAKTTPDTTPTITLDKVGSEMTNLPLPSTEGSNVRRVTRGYAKTTPVPTPESKSSQEKLPLEHIPSGTESSGIPRRVTRGGVAKILDPSGSASPEANDLKRKRSDTEVTEITHVSTPAGDLILEKKTVDYNTPKKSSKKGKAKGINRNQVKKVSADGVDKKTNITTQRKSAKIKDQNEISLPCRSSKRLAGLGSEPIVTVQACEEAPKALPAIDKSESVLAPVASQETTHEVFVSPVNPIDNVESEKKNDEFPDHQTDPKHLEISEPGKIDNQNLVYGPFSNTINMLFEDQADDPKEHVQNVDYENKESGNQEPDQNYAFGDSWSDPCLEFAYKTLTGALPIEDNPDVQDYIHQQSGITGSTPIDHVLAASHLNLPLDPPFMSSSNISLPSWKDASSRKTNGGDQ